MAMNNLNLWLFGSPRLIKADKPIGVKRHKALAILIYLAMTGEAQSRDSIATLFWPDSSQSRARASLRRDLSVLRKSVDPERLIIEQETIRLQGKQLWFDVLEFRSLIAESQQHGHPADTVCSACLSPLTRAVELYQDDFLAGFSLRDCPEFDEWQFFQTEALRHELATTLQKLVQFFITQEDYEKAIPYARRWVGLDPLHEPAHRQLIWLYSVSQQQAAALRQYQVCVQVLQDELGVKPSPETTALYEKIRRVRKSDDQGVKIDPQHNLPVPATAFVGRIAELTEFVRRLSDPACRLLTLVGPGGVGKTRLALQTAWHLVNEGTHGLFTDGIFYVRLSPISTAGELISAVSDAIHFSFYRDVEPQQQLLNYLREKEMLLVLDSFEHLIPDGIEFVAELLASAPAVNVLVTSREALKLQEEWVIPVEGMRYPSVDAPQHDLAGYSAIQLFMQNAQQVRPDFSFEHHQACILKICRLVEGMPLALELAAAWLKVLPCAEIAREIGRSLDLLTTTMRNVPERHRSIRAVFEHSWLLLTADEQTILQKLSILRGDFSQAAAEEIADASLLSLMALVEKSFIKVQENGRYHIHGLLRQFAAEKLDEHPETKTITKKKHHDFFMQLLQEQKSLLEGKQQKAALKALRQEMSNIQKAWQCTIEQHNIEVIAQGLDSLYQFYWMSSRYQDGADLFRQTAVQLNETDTPDPLLIQLTSRQGAFYAALGKYGLALELLQKSLSGARRLQLSTEIAFSLNVLGNVIAVQGDSIEAGALYKESLAISREHHNQTNTADALANLGWVTARQGDYQTAKQYFLEGLAVNRAIENESRTAHVLNSIGMVEFYLGEYPTAEEHLQESLEIFKLLRDQYGIARALSGLGIVAWGMGKERLTEGQQLIEAGVAINRAIGYRLELAIQLRYLGAVTNSVADYEAAAHHYTEALTIAREIGYSSGVPWSLLGLGIAAAGLGQTQTAQDYFHEALEMAILVQNLPIVLETMVSVAELRANNAQLDTAVALTTAAVYHPACWQIIKDKASNLLTKWETQLNHAAFAAAQERAKTTSIEEFAIEILTES